MWEAGAGREGWSQGAGVEAESWEWCRQGACEGLVGNACAGAGWGGWVKIVLAGGGKELEVLE